MPISSFYSIAKDIVKIILKVSNQNFKTNQQIIKFLKKHNLVTPQKEFQSIYIFSLIEYGERCEPKELISLFANEEVIAGFKNQLYEGGGTEKFDIALDHILHTSRDVPFLKLKREFDSLKLKREIEIFKDIFKQQTQNSKNPIDIETHEKLNTVIDEITELTGRGVHEIISKDKLMEELTVASQSLLTWPYTIGENGEWIERKEFDYIKKRMFSKNANTLLILGEPGTGKSALLSNITNSLIEEGFVVLGIKADMLPKGISDPSKLQQFLNLSCPINKALIECHEDKLPILIIDQLDALSELVDRNSERLNVLLALIQSVAKTRKIQIICSCRWFEYQNDVRLTTINAEKIDLLLPVWKDIEKILKQANFNVDNFSDETKALCRVPLHLKILIELKKNNDNITIPSSLQGLLEEIWQQKILIGENVSDKIKIIEQLSSKMADDEELWVARAIADSNPDAFKELQRSDILKLDNSRLKIGFTHQTYFDFARARSFATGRENLSNFVAERQDGLFIRPILLRTIYYLRDTSINTYSKELNALWKLDNIRAHIKNLLIEYIGSVEYPNEIELACLLPLFKNDKMKHLTLMAIAGSPGWFRSIKGTYLPQVMQEDSNFAHLCIPILSRAFSFDRESVLELIKSYWLDDETFDEIILSLMTDLTFWDQNSIDIVCRVAARHESRWIEYIAEIVSQQNPDLAPQIILADFEHQLYLAIKKESEHTPPNPPKKNETDTEKAIYELASGKKEFVQKLLRQNNNWHGLSLIAETSPKSFIDNLWPWFLKIIALIAEEPHPFVVGYQDDYCLGTTPERNRSREDEPISSFSKAIAKYAHTQKTAFIDFFKKNIDNPYLAVQRLLCFGLLQIVKSYPDIIFSYLTRSPKNLVIGDHEDLHKYSNKLISAVVPFLSKDQIKQLERIVLKWNRYYKEKSEWTVEDKFKRKKWNREHRLRILRAFPKEKCSDKFKKIIMEEERAFPNLKNWDSRIGGVHWVGSSMSKNQMTSGTDDHIIKLFGDLTDETEWDHPKRKWNSSSGGSIQASREFASFAEKNPERASKIILSFASQRQERPAGMGIDGLSNSNYPIDKIFIIIKKLISKEFSNSEFRRNVARGLQKIAKKNKGLPNDIIDFLKDWYIEESHPDINEPKDIEEQNEEQNDSILWGYGESYSLPGGRDIYFEAIAEGFLLRNPPDPEHFAEFIETILKFEKHPKIWQIAFNLMGHLFNWDKKRAAEYFDYIIKNVPEVMENSIGVIGYANVFLFVPEKKMVQNWITLVGSNEKAFRKQAYGELLFYYNLIYSNDLWGINHLESVLQNPTQYIRAQRGVAFAAAKHWHHIKHQKICTDTIIELSRTYDQITQNAIASIFLYGEKVTFSENMKKIIAAILPNDGILIQSAENLVEGIIDKTDIEPQIIGDICQRIIEVGKDEIKKLSSRYSMVAEPLVSIALTLHRMLPPYREMGLNLFENLIESNIPHARQALDILDRKPVTNQTTTRLRRRRQTTKKQPKPHIE